MGVRTRLLVFLSLVVLVCAQEEAETSVPQVTNAQGLVECEESIDCYHMGLKHKLCEEGVCVNERLFPLSDAEMAGSIGAFLATVIAIGSGLGGGGLLVPLYIILMGLSSHEAVPLSKATIFGGAIASFIMNVRKTHPLARGRPLIDYETMLMMEPMTLAGTIIGVNMNAVFPEWLITICIVLLLTQTSLRTLRKGKKIYKEESQADTKRMQQIVDYWRLLPYESQMKSFQLVANAYLKWKHYKRDDSQDQSVRLKIVHQMDDSLSNVDTTDSSSEDEGDALIHNRPKSSIVRGGILTLTELKTQRRKIPKADVGVLLLTWIALVLFSMAKGGHGSPSIIGLTCGSAGYWLLVSIAVPFFILITFYFGIKIFRTHTMLRALGYEYAKGDVVWTKDAVIRYPALCTAAGVAAGLLGIGGGMVKGPLLLEMGLLPQVSAATSSTMILFTSSATTVQFIVLGTLSVEHALWHGLVGFVGGVIGQVGMSYLIKKYRKSAFVIFLVAAVVGVSGMIMGVLGIERIRQVGFTGFRPLCQT